MNKTETAILEQILKIPANEWRFNGYEYNDTQYQPSITTKVGLNTFDIEYSFREDRRYVSIYGYFPESSDRAYIAGFNMNSKGFGKDFTNLITAVGEYCNKQKQKAEAERKKAESESRSKNLDSILSGLNKKI